MSGDQLANLIKGAVTSGFTETKSEEVTVNSGVAVEINGGMDGCDKSAGGVEVWDMTSDDSSVLIDVPSHPASSNVIHIRANANGSSFLRSIVLLFAL